MRESERVFGRDRQTKPLPLTQPPDPAPAHPPQNPSPVCRPQDSVPAHCPQWTCTFSPSSRACACSPPSRPCTCAPSSKNLYLLAVSEGLHLLTVLKYLSDPLNKQREYKLCLLCTTMGSWIKMPQPSLLDSQLSLLSLSLSLYYIVNVTIDIVANRQRHNGADLVSYFNHNCYNICYCHYVHYRLNYYNYT